MLDEKFEQNQTWSNIIQHNATIPNMVFKRTQHVGHNNVGWCWSNMLHPFKQALSERVSILKRVSLAIFHNDYHAYSLYFYPPPPPLISNKPALKSHPLLGEDIY